MEQTCNFSCLLICLNINHSELLAVTDLEIDTFERESVAYSHINKNYRHKLANDENRDGNFSTSNKTVDAN